jgi:ABC-type multidrug transport system ATPase subunit
MIAIETKQLKKSFGAVSIVKGIDLTVEQGEIFGFLGRNGAGKSTFINMLTDIIQPSSGAYTLLGVKGPNNQVKKRIGVMPDYSAKPVQYAGVDDVPLVLADSYYKWYMGRRSEIEIEIEIDTKL